MTQTLLLTVPEVARELRLHRTTVYDLIASGELETVDASSGEGTRPYLRVPLNSVVEFIERRSSSNKRGKRSAVPASAR